MRRLHFQLQLGDLLAQGLQAALGLQPALVAAAQSGSQVVVLAAHGAQLLFALELQRQGRLQAGLGGRIVERAQFHLELGARLGTVVHLLRGRLDHALQLAPPSGERADLELRLLRLALQRALLLPGV